MFWTKEKIFFTRQKPDPEVEDISYLNSIVDSIPLDEIEGVNIIGLDGAEDANISAGLQDETGFFKILDFFFNRIPSSETGQTPSTGRMARSIRDSRRASPSSTAMRSTVSREGSQDQLQLVYQLKTKADGFNSGRTYYVRVPRREQGQILDLCARAQTARQSVEAMTRFRKNQELVRIVYTSLPFQYMIASLIIAVGIPYSLWFRNSRALPRPAVRNPIAPHSNRPDFTQTSLTQISRTPGARTSCSRPWRRSSTGSWPMRKAGRRPCRRPSTGWTWYPPPFPPPPSPFPQPRPRHPPMSLSLPPSLHNHPTSNATP